MPTSAATPAELSWTSPELRDGVKAIALQRVLAVPLLASIGVARPDTRVVPLLVLAVFAMAIELWQLRQVHSERWNRFPLPVLLFVDIGMVALGVALTGGARSPIAYVGLLTIFPATFAFPPRYMAWLCAWTMASMGGVVIADALADDHLRAALTYAAAVAFTSVVAINAARVREATSRSLRELAAARRRLVAESAQAEARDRRRMSQQLHDQGLQSLLSARQDLDEVAAGDPQALEFARAALGASVGAIRDLVYDIDPAALSGTRLPEALQALVERSTPPAGVHVRTAIDPAAAGDHDDLLHAVGRELLRRASTHPGVTLVTVALRRDGAVVELEVTDDGRELAFDDGHAEGTVGVASAAARVDAAGGTLRIDTQPAGTRIVVRIADAAGTAAG